MKIRIPKAEDPMFDREVISILKGLSSWMTDKYGIKPDQYTFNGSIGKVLYNRLEGIGWESNEIKVLISKGKDTLIMEYTNGVPIKKDERMKPKRGETLDGKIISGIPSSKTMANIVGGAIGNFSFDVEKTEFPKLEITLEYLNDIK